MGYFSNKPKATAESVSGMLTNTVKENLTVERDKYNEEIKCPEPISVWFTDHKFSGEGVDAIKKGVEEEFQKFNTYSRFKVEETATDRKDLFNNGPE